MLSVLARSHLFKLNNISKLVESSRINLISKPNLNKCQVKHFKSRRSGSNEMIKDESKLNQFKELFQNKIFSASVSAVAGSALFFSLSAIWSYETLKNLRKINPYYQQNPFYKKSSHTNQGNILNWWNSLKDHQKVAYTIIALNLLVFLAWRIPELEPFMYKYFTVNSISKPTFLPMLLSTFSHHSFTHLFFNMYCLLSFSVPATFSWGKESMIALYLSSGMFGSLASILMKTYQASMSCSLGASAAILGLVSSTCILHPDQRISIIFLPFFSLTAQNALIGIVAVDSAGLLLGWKLFDHAGHLGGCLFGIWYTKYGHKTINKLRKKVAKIWHKIRS